MNTTAEEVPAMEAATAQKPVKFLSKGRNYRAILLTPIDRPHPVTGEKMMVQKGFTAEFSRGTGERGAPEFATDGSFQWPPPENDEYAPYVREDGIYVDPESGQEVDVVARLRSHPDLNVQFVELGPDPAELREQEKALLAEISKCSVRGDVERLAEIYDEEQAGLARETVLTASMEGLRAVEEALAEQREPANG